jgi:CRISPR/Cas system-associated exonuclease Cas4 (RecB family)
VVEAKYSTPPIDGGMWSGDRLQLLGYLAGIDELGWVESIGKVIYHGNQVAEIRYTEENAAYLRSVAEKLDTVQDGGVVTPSYRCDDCVWEEVCPWAR